MIKHWGWFATGFIAGMLVASSFFVRTAAEIVEKIDRDGG
jgi:hypothetical protein